MTLAETDGQIPTRQWDADGVTMVTFDASASEMEVDSQTSRAGYDPRTFSPRRDQKLTAS